MKSLVIAVACVTAFFRVSFAQGAAGVLSDDGKTLTVTVEENAVAAFDPALLLSNVDTVTNLVKLGKGLLELGVEDDLSAYLGAITIREGTYRMSASNNVGCVTMDGSGPVSVEDGGAIEIKASKAIRMPKKTFHVSGSGPYGKGAVIYNCTGEISGTALGNHVCLYGDTLLAITNRAHIYWNIRHMKVDYRGHRLRVVNTVSGATESFIVGFPQFDAGDGGALIMDGSRLQLMNGDNNNFMTNDTGRLVVTNRGCLQLSSVYGDLKWGVDVYDGGYLQCAGNWQHVDNSGNVLTDNVARVNKWLGPVRLHQERTRFSIMKGQRDGSSMGFAGPISGGGIYAYKLSPAADYTPYLHLYNPENSFTGGLAVNLLNLYLWSDGALPVEGGDLMCTNSTVMLMDDFHSLPGAVFSGTGAVNNARGHWNGPVRKVDQGTFVYNSLAGGEKLDVQEGTFRIVPRSERAKYAGLMEGDAFYSDSSAAQSAAQGPSILTNRLTMGASAMYDDSYRDFWEYSDTQQYKDGAKRRMFSYSGWLWNDSPTNEVWTFAGAAGTTMYLWVGEKRVLRIGWDGKTLGIGTNTITPGANRFVLTVYCSDSGAGPRSSNNLTNAVWKTNSGLCYRKGDWRDNVNVAYFSRLIDPGDGSLLTYRRPGDTDCPYPGEDFTEDNLGNRGASFTDVSVRRGASIDLGGADYHVSTISGAPSVQNCPVLTVQEKIVLETQEVLGGGKFVTDGAIAFGSGAKLELDYPVAKVASGDYTVIEAAGGITGDVSLPSSADYALWRIGVSGNAVILKRLAKGLCISVR